MVWIFMQALMACFGIIGFAGFLLRQSKRFVFLPSGKNMAIAAMISVPVFFARGYISNEIQYIEQAYITPTYIVADSSAWAVGCFEQELQKHCTPEQFRIVRDSTYALARDLGCDPLAIYEVALSECGMSPFAIRQDGIAAGWIQFTAAGLSGFGVSLSEVKNWCQKGDAESVMAMTGKYMRTWAKGQKVRTSADVYCIVFAPAKVGQNVLYSGWNKPEYYMNKGLDGYRIEGRKAMYLPYTRDGVLDKQDLTAALAFKKAVLLEKYK